MATTRTRTKHSVTVAGKVFYLNNKDLLPEVITSKAKGEMTPTLAKMLMLLCSNYAKKGNFVNYSYNEDMQAYALMMLVRTWKSFDPAKSNNPFAFFTQCIKHSFIQYLNHEKRQRDVRDALLVDQGFNPSFGYDDGNDGPRGIEDEQDFDTIRSTADSLSSGRFVDGPIERDEKGVEITPIPVEEDPVPEEPAEQQEEQ